VASRFEAFFSATSVVIQDCSRAQPVVSVASSSFQFPAGLHRSGLGYYTCERFVIVQERVGLDFSMHQLLTLVSVMESSCDPGRFSCFVLPLATKTHIQISPNAGRSWCQRVHA
jgi:hypothetical protein